MQKKIFIYVLCSTSLLAGTVLFNPLSAKEPHHAEAHKYVDSIYTSDPVLSLEMAIRLAIEASPRLQSAYARLDAAKGLADQAGYWLNPEIGFEAENIVGGGLYRGTDSAQYTYGLSQKVEIGGKRSARKGAAAAAQEVANTELLAERMNLERDVHIAYSDVLAEAEALKLAIEQEELAKDVLVTVARRVDAAAEPEIQRSKAEVAYATSAIAREQGEHQLHISKGKLARLWGASSLAGSLDHAYFFELESPQSLEIYQKKLNRLPDIQKLAYRQAEKEALLELEKAQKIPDPSFSLGVRDFRDSGDQALVFSVSLPIPVLNQNRGNIARARAELSQAESDARQTELMLEHQLTENWQHWNTAYLEAERLQNKLLPIAEKAFSLARSGYEKGKFSYLEVLDTQRTLFDAQAEYYNSLKRYHAARAYVERLTTETGEQK